MIDDIVGHENDLMFCSRTGLEVGVADREPCISLESRNSKGEPQALNSQCSMFLPPFLMDTALLLFSMHEVVLVGSRFHNPGSADVTETIVGTQLSTAGVVATVSSGPASTGKLRKFLPQTDRWICWGSLVIAGVRNRQDTRGNPPRR